MVMDQGELQEVKTGQLDSRGTHGILELVRVSWIYWSMGIIPPKNSSNLGGKGAAMVKFKLVPQTGAPDLFSSPISTWENIVVNTFRKTVFFLRASIYSIDKQQFTNSSIYVILGNPN